MKVTSSYSVKIKNYSRIFVSTVELYRGAVDFYIRVIAEEWEAFSTLTQLEAVNLAEKLSVCTNRHPCVKYDFSKEYYKFPAYLRRSAIAEAFGKVSSYKSNLSRWETADSGTRGKRPTYPKAGYIYPCLYRENMFRETGNPYIVQIKVYIRNTWDWITVRLKKSDVDYIMRHCAPFTAEDSDSIALRSRKICAPTLQKRGREWFLDFPIEEKVSLEDLEIYDRTAAAVDLGINNACTVSIMRSDGTVIGRKFLSLPVEKDSLEHAVNRIKKAQQHGNRKTPRLWAAAKGINDRIAVLTAQFIVDTAVLYSADTIVFEHLDRNGKKRGSKKQKLHMWRSQYVQEMVANKAHRLGMHISHICAWGTSRLAYDGSGKVLRGKEAELPSYSVCKFQTGKEYNCDLNASYNIGARYFIREIIKSVPETARLQLEAKVPQVCKRSTCTLSTLINLNAALAA